MTGREPSFDTPDHIPEAWMAEFDVPFRRVEDRFQELQMDSRRASFFEVPIEDGWLRVLACPTRLPDIMRIVVNRESDTPHSLLFKISDYYINNSVEKIGKIDSTATLWLSRPDQEGHWANAPDSGPVIMKRAEGVIASMGSSYNFASPAIRMDSGPINRQSLLDDLRMLDKCFREDCPNLPW